MDARFILLIRTALVAGILSLRDILVLQEVVKARGKPLNLREMGLELATTKAAPAAIIEKLVRKKLVKRVRSETDARYICVTLTEKGCELAFMLGVKPH